MPRRYKKVQKKTKNAKREVLKKHARKRLRQRFGIDGAGVSEAIRLIQTGKAEFIKRQSLRVTIWAIQLDGKEVIAVYDKVRNTIVTFLPDRTRLGDDYGNISAKD